MDPVAPLTVRVDHDADGTAVVVLAGQLDLATATGAERAFAGLPVPSGTGVGEPRVDVVVDMTDLTFMDSSGLAVLLLAVRRGHAVRLRRPTVLVRQIIAATGLSQILPIEP